MGKTVNIDRDITLYNRYGDFVGLKHKSGMVYNVVGNLDYCRMIFEDSAMTKIQAIDPSGGPFMMVGNFCIQNEALILKEITTDTDNNFVFTFKDYIKPTIECHQPELLTENNEDTQRAIYTVRVICDELTKSHKNFTYDNSLNLKMDYDAINEKFTVDIPNGKEVTFNFHLTDGVTNVTKSITQKWT